MIFLIYPSPVNESQVDKFSIQALGARGLDFYQQGRTLVSRRVQVLRAFTLVQVSKESSRSSKHVVNKRSGNAVGSHPEVKKEERIITR